MKNISTYLMAVVFMLMTGPAWAGSLKIPNTFSSGTKAMASQVNDNFNAVKTAVDDNDTRISNNTANKQDRVSGACGAGYAIRSINADGTVVCQADSNTTYTAGTGLALSGTSFSVSAGNVSINPATFFAQGMNIGGCTQARNMESTYYTAGTGGDCIAYAGVTLPDHVSIQSLTCTMLDNSSATGAYLQVALYRVNLTTGSRDLLFGVTTPTNSASKVTHTGSSLLTAGANITDNSTYSYALQAAFGFSSVDLSTVTTNLQLYSCRVAYQP